MGLRYVVDRGRLAASGVEWEQSRVYAELDAAQRLARGVVRSGDCDAARVQVAHTAGIVLRRKGTVFLVTTHGGELREAS